MDEAKTKTAPVAPSVSALGEFTKVATAIDSKQQQL